jgi:hypothetical protein
MAIALDKASTYMKNKNLLLVEQRVNTFNYDNRQQRYTLCVSNGRFLINRMSLENLRNFINA